MDVVGTNAITGLNVKEAAHLIQPHQLQVSKNGWTEEDGSWSVARRPESLYTSSGIVAYEAGRMNGADHHVWISGTTLYDNGASQGTITGADSSTDIVAVDDAFLIVAASKNYIYDGDHIRELGSWEVSISTDTGFQQKAATSYSITAITNASNAVVTCGAHGILAGEVVYISGATGMTQINGGVYDVVSVTATTVTIDCNSTNFDSYSASGTIYRNGCGLTGDYKFYLVGTITLSDGTVLLGKPVPIGDSDEVSGVAFAGLDPETYTLAATDHLLFNGIISWSVSGVAEFDITGTIGTDYSPGLRLYRTKANGFDLYLEKEWTHGDSDFQYSAGADAYYAVGTAPGYAVHVPDRDLGAALDYETYEHTNMPQSEFVAFAGQRAWVASGKTLYWSTLDGIEYGSEANNTLMFDTITALGSWRDYCIVFSADRMWAVRITGGFPEVENIPTPAGTIWPKAIRETNLGLLYARTDGVYVYNGGQPQKMSRWAFKDLTAPSSIVQAGDIIYVCGSEAAYVAQERGDGWTWHESDHDITTASQTSGALYGADSSRVYSLFTGSRTEGSLKTKKFGGFDSSCTYKVELDYSGDTIPSIKVNGNVRSDVKEHEATISYSYPDRRVLWVWVPRLTNNYVEVEMDMVGNAELHGLRIFKER